MKHRLHDRLPDSVGRPPERCGFSNRRNAQRSRPPILPLEYRPRCALAEESSSLTTAGSRACRGCPKGWPRTPQSTVRPRQPLRVVGLHTLEKASQASRLGILNGFASSTGSSRFPVGQWPRLNNAAPFAPAPLQDLSSLLRAAPLPALRFWYFLAPSRLRSRSWLVPSRRRRDGAQRFSRSIRKPGRASRRLHAGCHSGRIRHPPS